MKDQTLKKDAGKPRWELLPLACIEGTVNVLTFGAKKYKDNGWKDLMETQEGEDRVIASLLRHLLAIQKHGITALDLNENGEVDENHSGLPHIDHFNCNGMFLKYRQLWLDYDDKKIKWVCNECGSDELIYDGNCVWDTEKQEFYIDGILGKPWCRQCYGETSTERVSADES